MNRAFSGGGAKVSTATVSQASEDRGPSSRSNAGVVSNSVSSSRCVSPGATEALWRELRFKTAFF